MADGNRPNNMPKPNMLSEYRLRLKGDKVGNDSKVPTLGFSIKKNNPQIDVRTGVQNDKDYGRISAKLDTFTWFAVAQALRELHTREAGYKFAIKINAVRFINGKRSDPMLDTSLTIGRDENGVAYLGVTSWEKDRPVIRFRLLPDQLISFVHQDGRPWEASELSLLYAKGFAATMESLAPFILYHEYQEPPPRDGGNGGGNWGGNRGGQGGGGGGYQQRQGGGGGYGGGGNNNSGGGYDSSAGGDDSFPM